MPKPKKKTAPPSPPKPPPVLAYDARTAASLRRLAKLGVVKLKPSADGTAVFVTREGTIALRANPIRVSRADLRTLQSLAARECAAKRRVRVETAADVEHARAIARSMRAEIKAATKADVERARAARDSARATAAGSCDAARVEVADAKGRRRSRVSPSERASERAAMRDAEVRAELGDQLGAWEFYKRTGGAVKWGGPKGVERLRHAVEEEGPNEIARYAPDLPSDEEWSRLAYEDEARRRRQRGKEARWMPQSKRLRARLGPLSRSRSSDGL